jgi:transaldolase
MDGRWRCPSSQDGLLRVTVNSRKIARKNKCIPVIASLRNAKQMLEIAEIGHDCFTISPEVARDLFDSKLTDAAVIAFEEAAKGDEK